MGIAVATVRIACNTGTGNQTITASDLGGLTPKAALFIVSRGATDGVAVDHAVLSLGMATGASNEMCFCAYDEHGQANSDASGINNVTNCVAIYNLDDSADGIANFVSFNANNVIINWTDAPAAAYLMTVVLFAGSDLSAHADTWSFTDSVDEVIDVTDPGFEPDVVFVFHTLNSARWHLGLVHNDRASGITQRAMECHSRDALGTSETVGHLAASYGEIIISGALGTIYTAGEFGTFDSNGFSITQRINGYARDCYYLALRFGAGPVVSSWVGTISTPTSIGNDGVTAPSFTPQFVLQGLSFMEAVDTAYTDGHAGSFGVGAFDSDDENSTSKVAEDAVGTTNTQSLSDNQAVNIPDHDGTQGVEASFVSFDANGWTLNYSAVDANARLFIALAIEEEVAAVEIPKNQLSILQAINRANTY